MAARVALLRAALEDNVSPEALEGCGTAAWWLEEFPTTIASREEAYRAFRSTAGPRRGRAHATWLANDYADYQGELAVANGWIRPAERLLEDLPRCGEHGVYQGALRAHGPSGSRGGQAPERGGRGDRRTVGPAGFEMVGLALEGLALVIGGAVGRLMGRRARRTEPPRPVSAMAKSSPISRSGEVQAARGA